MTVYLTPAADLAAQSPARWPNESAGYRKARTDLLAAEIALRRHIQTVAAQRRALPAGGEVAQNYAFEGRDGPVGLSDLFGRHATLILYSMMYGPDRAEGCPMCSAQLDAWDGAVRHIEKRAALAVIARSPIDRILAYAGSRGWTGLTFLSDPSGDRMEPPADAPFDMTRMIFGGFTPIFEMGRQEDA